MAPSTPFVDRTDGTIDLQQALTEAIPLARLVGQFVLAAGSGIVLIYVVVCAIQLVDAGAPRADGRTDGADE